MSFEEELAPALASANGMRLAVLFGSRARGTARPGSDLDIAVLLDDEEDLATLGVALERAVGRRVDLVSLRSAPPLLRFEIARDGRLLFEREPHDWAEFRAHAMIDWWDWAPTARIVRSATRARLEHEAGRGPS